MSMPMRIASHLGQYNSVYLLGMKLVEVRYRQTNRHTKRAGQSERYTNVLYMHTVGRLSKMLATHMEVKLLIRLCLVATII